MSKIYLHDRSKENLKSINLILIRSRKNHGILVSSKNSFYT